MGKYNVTAVFEFDDVDIVDIISSAVYDIRYWAVIDNSTKDWKRVSDSLPEYHTFEEVMLALMKTDGGVDILDSEGTDGPWNLTLEKMLKGIKLTIEHGFWNGKLDDIDGEVGDIIFQYALFDEIVYG